MSLAFVNTNTFLLLYLALNITNWSKEFSTERKKVLLSSFLRYWRVFQSFYCDCALRRTKLYPRKVSTQRRIPSGMPAENRTRGSSCGKHARYQISKPTDRHEGVSNMGSPLSYPTPALLLFLKKVLWRWKDLFLQLAILWTVLCFRWLLIWPRSR
jgi:hypothetical protein